MATDEKEVESLRKAVDKKRDQLEKARRDRVEKEQGLSNDIELAQLKAEEARLDAAIAGEKQFSTVSAVRDGASVPLEQAKDEMKLALAQQEGVTALAEADAAAQKAAADEEKKES